MSKRNPTQRWLGVSLVALLVAGCGLVPGAGTDPAREDPGMAAKLRRVALAQLCQRGMACEAEQVDRAVQALGAMLDELPPQDELKQLAHDDADAPPSAADVAGLMEMFKAMAGSDAFADEGDDGVADVAIAPVQPGGAITATAPRAIDTAAEGKLMAGLGGIPVRTGRLTSTELRERFLTPPSEE